MPVYLGTVLIIGAALAAIAIPLAIVAFPNTVSLDKALTAMTPRAALALLAIMVLAIFLGVRMLMGTPVASAEHIGPIAIIKRSWALTSGKWWKLFGFLMALFIAAAVLMLAIGAVAGSVLTIALGPIESMSVSALLIGLVQGLFNAAFTALFAVMIARLYVQLSGRDAVEMTD